MSRDVHIHGLGDTGDDACYRAMDWLHVVRGELKKQVYFQVADLLNLEVDLLFFDTTSTYFELKEADEKVLRDWRREKTAARDDADEDRTPGSARTASQGQSRWPAADRDRDGGHPRRDPGSGMVLAREHRRGHRGRRQVAVRHRARLADMKQVLDLRPVSGGLKEPPDVSEPDPVPQAEELTLDAPVSHRGFCLASRRTS